MGGHNVQIFFLFRVSILWWQFRVLPGTKAHGHSTSYTSAMKLLSAGSSAKYANPSERSVYCLKNCLESLSLTVPKATFLSP